MGADMNFEFLIYAGSEKEFDSKGSLLEINSILSYCDSAWEKAMDLSVHTKKDGQIRTIFEDAEYFSKNYSYKLMPVTFESVNETIIHIEHNYCHWTPSDMPDSHENLNSTTYSEIEEINYKKRKIKSLPMDKSSISKDYEKEGGEALGDFVSGNERGEFLPSTKLDDDCGVSMQPLDLSLPLLQEQKTDKMLTENQSNIPKVKPETKSSPDIKQFNTHESNKENVTTSSRKIEVTISRPGQKEYYQPCEIFLNDLARISPDLIKNDCYEIEIIDRTHSQDFQKEICRTYYIILESTWRIFENSTERIILTNDLNIGQPIQNNEKYDKPRYLIFDQYSLTESLAQICADKGGSFEYTCLEEPKESCKVQDSRNDQSHNNCEDHGSDCLKNKFNLEREPGRVGDRNGNNNNADIVYDEGRAKVSNDRARSFGISNYEETNFLESLLTSNELNCKAKMKAAELYSGNLSTEKGPPKNPKIESVSENKDSTESKGESRICEHDPSTEPVKSPEPNLLLTKPEKVPAKCKDTDNICDNPGSSSKVGEAELKHELINKDECVSDVISVKVDPTPQSKHRGRKRARIIEENRSAISRKSRKLRTSVEVQNVKENSEVQNELSVISKEEKTEVNSNSSVRITRSKNSRSLGKEEAKSEKVSVGDIRKIEGSKKIKEESSENKKKISSADIKNRPAKEVSVLRNGKQRCAPSALKKQQRDSSGSVKALKVKLEKKEEVTRTRARAGKPVSEGKRKICLRKRT